ncbi:hypothetical protein [Salinigranum salinum]|uniref:hypothetical protein n=1 Tax=Salinigranum salinum TaxID=1364937 RepID=UPI001260BCD8|nr:hypothetical protein [Salinigranum salinum]
MDRRSGRSSRAHTGSDRWWLVLLAIPLVFLCWLSLSIVGLGIAPHVPLRLTSLVVDVQGALVVASFALSLLAPFVVHHDRRHVAARTAWTPSVLYYLVVVPLVNVLVATLYLWRRHRQLGRP